MHIIKTPLYCHCVAEVRRAVGVVQAAAETLLRPVSYSGTEAMIGGALNTTEALGPALGRAAR